MSEDFESKHFQCCVSKAFENDSATAGSSAWDILPFCPLHISVALSSPRYLPLPASPRLAVQNGYLFPSSDTYFPKGTPSISKNLHRSSNAIEKL